jgi:hypothetical protein
VHRMRSHACRDKLLLLLLLLGDIRDEEGRAAVGSTPADKIGVATRYKRVATTGAGHGLPWCCATHIIPFQNG